MIEEWIVIELPSKVNNGEVPYAALKKSSWSAVNLSVEWSNKHSPQTLSHSKQSELAGIYYSLIALQDGLSTLQDHLLSVFDTLPSIIYSWYKWLRKDNSHLFRIMHNNPIFQTTISTLTAQKWEELFTVDKNNHGLDFNKR